MSGVRIVVADDHSLFREGLQALLRLDATLDVVGEASSGIEAVDVVARLTPDILLLDVSMPGLPVHETLEEVARRSSCTRTAILTMHDDRALRSSLLEAGASAFWPKSLPSSQLIDNLKALMRAPREDALKRPRGGRSTGGTLSAREIEVVRLVGGALGNKQIANRLGIAEGTVKRHLSSIFEKLGATTRLDAARKAARLGITVLDQ
ncbi:MAG: response regulator transcription factor [Actinobacteria bacterium]|nr:response regulator transcription factor [Actinomycetota bacterium]